MAGASTSYSSRRPFRRPAAHWFLAALVVLLPSARARADSLADRLDQILKDSSPGIVRIEVRRPWTALGADTVRDDRQTHLVLRITGNGVCWDRSGHIITVNDLAQPFDTLEVIGPGGERVPAAFVGQDPDAGVSLIQANGLDSVKPLPHGPSTPLSMHAWVLMLGSCGSGHASQKLMLGRVRGLVSPPGGTARARLDGSIDPGLAGGSLLDGDGRLIGLLLGEGSEGLMLGPGAKGVPMEFGIAPGGGGDTGWALPIEQIEQAADRLLQARGVGQGFLGVAGLMPSKDPAAARAAGPGFTIEDVLPGSPAARADIRPGDRLVGFAGSPVISWDDLTLRVSATEPGRSVRIELLRDGKELAVDVRMVDRGRTLWQAKQRALAEGRERMLRRQIEGLRQQLELVRHQLISMR